METALKYRTMLYESIAETSEELMEKFFSDEEITRDEAMEAIHHGIITGSIVPVFCGLPQSLWGVRNLLDAMRRLLPRPTAKGAEKIITDGGI